MCVAQPLRHPGEVGVDDDGGFSHHMVDVAVGSLSSHTGQFHQMFGV